MNHWTAILNSETSKNIDCPKKMHRIGIQLWFTENYFTFDNITVLFYGKIFKDTYEINEVEKICEWIVYLYQTYGFVSTVQLLNGKFSFLLLDNSTMNEKLYVVRDPIGVCPLNETGTSITTESIGTEFLPATYSVYKLSLYANAKWEKIVSNERYYVLPYRSLGNFVRWINDDVLKECVLKHFRGKMSKTFVIGILLQDCHLNKEFMEKMKEIFQLDMFAYYEMTIHLEIFKEDTAYDFVFSDIGFCSGYVETLDTSIQYRKYISNVYLELPRKSNIEYPCLDLDYVHYRCLQ